EGAKIYIDIFYFKLAVKSFHTRVEGSDIKAVDFEVSRHHKKEESGLTPCLLERCNENAPLLLPFARGAPVRPFLKSSVRLCRAGPVFSNGYLSRCLPLPSPLPNPVPKKLCLDRLFLLSKLASCACHPSCEWTGALFPLGSRYTL